MKFASVTDIKAKAATIKAYVREAIAVEKAGLRVAKKKTSDFPVPDELTERLRTDPRFGKRAFEGADAGAAEELFLPLCRGQAVGDAGGADRKGDAGDIRRQRVSGEALVPRVRA